MKLPVNIGLVAAGYVAALLIAIAAVALYASRWSAAGHHASAGMLAIGDGLVFVGAFAVAAIPATGAALVFFRPYRRFWIALAAGALCIAFSALAVLRIFVAPVFALVWFHPAATAH